MYEIRQFMSGRPAPRHIAAMFLIYGLLAVGFLSVNMPPFQNADEPAHFARAMQCADGNLLGARFVQRDADGRPDESAGARIDTALLRAFRPVAPLLFHPEVKADRSLWSPAIHWSNERQWVGFPNTVLYPPLFYFPSALGIVAGRSAGLTVVQTLILSRLLTGGAAVAIATAAVACAGGAAIWLFAVLTLPMSLALLASTSQDALMLSCAALAGASLVRLCDGEASNRQRVFAACAVLLTFIALARVPYIVLAALPLVVPRIRFPLRVAAMAGIAGSVLAWSVLMSATVFVKSAGARNADPAAQLALLVANPAHIIDIALETSGMWRLYADTFIGQLGWLDTTLPRWYFGPAWVVLGVAAVAAMLRPAHRLSLASHLLMALVILGCSGAVFATLYITGTAPGNPVVDGVAGRYFLPIALAGTAILPAIGRPGLQRLRCVLTVPVLLFPVISLPVVMRAVVLRYYLN